MNKAKWKFYTSKEIKPRGWLRRQLRIQADGLCGNLDKVWRDVRDSAWIGGDAESWERVPYWLDGFIPLAYLLEDDGLIMRAQKYIDAILAMQKEDGWICPCPDDKREEYDTWALILICKVLTVWYDCSGDERIPGALYRVLKNYYELLAGGKIRLFSWAKFRWFEIFPAIGRIYELYGEPWLKELAGILHSQGQDYDELCGEWQTPINRWRFETHIVNICMALKSEAVFCELTGTPYRGLADKWTSLLRRYNGTPVGLFTGDECLSGLSPIQGTELCAVVEQMYSYETLYAYTGNSKWAEELERIAFNALPATLSDDMWAHQYVQQSNQISCEKIPGKSVFRTNGAEAHLFGLEPNYGCCTANFGQGWPKLALSAFMHRRTRRGDEIISAVPVPSELHTSVGGKEVHITLDTDYPFKNRFSYKIECGEDTAFTFVLRVPSFAKNATLDGKPVACGDIGIDVKGSKTLNLEYETEPEFFSRPHGLRSVRCGSLVFSLPIEYEKKMYEYERKGVERKFPYCDYEYIGSSEWSFGFTGGGLVKSENEVPDTPFSSEKPAVTVRAGLVRINCGLEDGYLTVCAKTPHSRKAQSGEREIELIPYGCAKLRMTEMPVARK